MTDFGHILLHTNITRVADKSTDFVRCARLYVFDSRGHAGAGGPLRISMVVRRKSEEV